MIALELWLAASALLGILWALCGWMLGRPGRFTREDRAELAASLEQRLQLDPEEAFGS
jgi:hypothetical protein